jgi:hypothetical protein
MKKTNYMWLNLTPAEESLIVELLKQSRNKICNNDHESGNGVIFTDILVNIRAETKEQANKLYPTVTF